MGGFAVDVTAKRMKIGGVVTRPVESFRFD